MDMMRLIIVYVSHMYRRLRLCCRGCRREERVSYAGTKKYIRFDEIDLEIISAKYYICQFINVDFNFKSYLQRHINNLKLYIIVMHTICVVVECVNAMC